MKKIDEIKRKIDEIDNLTEGNYFDELIASCVFKEKNILPYSSNINAAWRVVDWLRNRWGLFELSAGLGWHCWYELKDAKIWGYGNTAPLAICRAALLTQLK